MHDSVLINQNLLIGSHYNNDFKKDLYCPYKSTWTDDIYSNNSNNSYYIEYNTKENIYWVYSLGKRSQPHFQIQIYNKTSRTYLRYGKDCDSRAFFEKRINMDWIKAYDASLSLTSKNRLVSDIEQMLNTGLSTNNPAIIYVLLSQLAKTYGEHDSPFDEYNYIKTEFLLKYKTLLETAKKWMISKPIYDFLQLGKRYPYQTGLEGEFLNDNVSQNYSNYENDLDAKKVSEFGVTIRYAFNKDIIGKRYVPPITKTYTVTVDKFYVNGQEVKITKDKTSTSGGYNEDRYGYIAIYQLINASNNYLIVPLSITGSAKFTEQVVYTTGFFNNKEIRGNAPTTNKFEVQKAFLLEPRSTLKEQLETGEEVPSDFRIQAREIQKVDITWVNQLSKALGGDLQSLKQMLDDKKAKYWYNNLREVYSTAMLKVYRPLVDISVVPLNSTTFDPDFDSEVKVIVNNRSSKILELYFASSFGKKGILIVEPSKKASSTFTIKGYKLEDLKASIEKITIATTNNLATVKDIEGNSYKTVIIGNQIWMAENLKVTKFNDGSDILNVADEDTWKKLNSPAFCWYDNQLENKPLYGGLYNWYTVNTHNLCPLGWHVPSHDEWTNLTNNLEGVKTLSRKLKSTWGWNNNDNGTNEYGFSAFPGGGRSLNFAGLAKFEDIGNKAFFWTSSESQNNSAWLWRIELPFTLRNDLGPKLYENLYLENYWGGSKYEGFSVRCVKD